MVIYWKTLNLGGNNLRDIDVEVLRLLFLRSLNLVSKRHKWFAACLLTVIYFGS